MPEADVTTIALRFRDLGLAQGETIQQHQVLIDRFGFTWWAWWHKAGEAAPVELMRRLQNDARAADGIGVYLYDSGRQLLFQAKVRDIALNDAGSPISSPLKRATPAYYRTAPYRMWFKIDHIRPAAAEAIRSFSYVRVDSFFENRSSRFSPFYDKRVDGLAELQDQNRTIWFLRRYRTADREGRVELFESLRNEASAFTRRFAQADSARILWLSDVHMSDNRSEHGFPIVPSAAQKPLAQALEKASGDVKNYGGLLISGDLTWRAAGDQFEFARSLIGDIRSWSGLEANQVGVIPGNHDLKFSSRPFANDEPITETWADARAGYATFYEQEFFQPPNPYLSMGRRYLLRNVIPVEVVLLNSSLLQQAANQFQGHGFIGDEQMSAAASQMGWRGPDDLSPRAYRIVVLHHHLLPMTYRQEPAVDAAYSTVLDAEALTRWLVLHRVDLVLHGHMHEPGVARVARPLNIGRPADGAHEFSVVAMGSSGVAAHHLGETPHNTFGILDFSHGAPVVSIASVHATNPTTSIWSVQLPLR